MKNIDFTDAAWVPVFVSIAAFAIIFAVAVGTAHMRSSTFNRLTGAHTTWVDALWVELRVQDSPR